MLIEELDGRLLIGIADFGKQLKYNAKTLNDMKKRGDLDDALVQVADRKVPLLDLGRAVQIMEGAGDFAKHQTRKMKGEADKLERENALAEGKVVEAARMRRFVFDVVHAFVKRVEIFPVRVAPLLAREMPEAEARQVLQAELDQMRRDLDEGLGRVAAGLAMPDEE